MDRHGLSAARGTGLEVIDSTSNAAAVLAHA
jgi:hypothetical protein